MAISIVWLKRDLRVSDHEPLLKAAQSGHPVLLVYCFEPMLLNDPHYKPRHWQFVLSSLKDIAARVPQGALYISFKDVQYTFAELHDKYTIAELYSYQEIGLNNTFERDKLIASCCENAGITWHETPYGAVIRGLTHRKTWDEYWQKVMRAPTADIDLNTVNWCVETEFSESVKKASIDEHPEWFLEAGEYQQGGEKAAKEVLDSFFDTRGQAYSYSVSSPILSQTHCSRLSPYLAWGNISLRQAYQAVLKNWQKKGWRRSLVAFTSRLHWHCHFIQKFESQSSMEFEPVNLGYTHLPRADKALAAVRLAAWQQGKTGVPMVDACMRCLIATGYINFRMRAMLVSFLCHHLEVDWRQGAPYLASLFLDFEPGIHYSQMQMQAGVTGFNTIRIYSPVKQGLEKDPEGEFVKRWVPELENIPSPLVHEPWQLSPMEQLMYGVELGKDYPEPIVDVSKSYKAAQDLLWKWRNRPEVRAQVSHLLARHVRPD
jgi:deoxyribodipyrimidine photo-lyase